MFLSIFAFVLLIQVWKSINPIECSKVLIKKNVEKLNNNKNAREDAQDPQDVNMFANIRELTETTGSFDLQKRTTPYNRDETFNELKSMLLKMLCKLDNIEQFNKEQIQRNGETTETVIATGTETGAVTETLNPLLTLTLTEVTEASMQFDKKRYRNDLSAKRKSRWGRWTPWSACSVTCGKGREIRWRHCIEECDIAETEMEEKSCQLPACAPKHIFGIH